MNWLIRPANRSGALLGALSLALVQVAAQADPLQQMFVISDLVFVTSSENGNPFVRTIVEPGSVGHLLWQYNAGDFANGTGMLIDLQLPITTFPLSSAIIDVSNSGITGTNPGNIDNLSYDFQINFSPALTSPTSSATVTSGSFDFTGVYLYLNAEWIGSISGGTIAPQAARCPADLNGDGAVDLADLAVLLVNYGLSSGATGAMGDLNGDGAVDLADLSMLLVAFGTACP